MIEITLKAYGHRTCAALAEFLPVFIEAEKADYAEEREEWETLAPAETEETVKRVVEEAAAEEPAPKKRGRPKKEEPVANISATPEDRQPPLAEVEDAEIVDENSADGMFEDVPPEPVTEQDIREALNDLVESMNGSAPAAMEWLNTHFGTPRLSGLKEGIAAGRFTAEAVVSKIRGEIA